MKNTFGGGKETTKNGLKFEQETSIIEAVKAAGYNLSEKNQIIINNKIIGMITQKYGFYKDFLNPMGVDFKQILSKRMLPDAVFINFFSKKIYIIEKKFQSRSGSVDEKLQTCDFKKKRYQELVKSLGYSIEYVYLCNDWFKRNEYKDTLNYIKETNCHIFYNSIPLSFLGLPNPQDISL